MIGIVTPADNEENHITVCLSSVLFAAEHPVLANQPVAIIVVLDHCSIRPIRLFQLSVSTALRSLFTAWARRELTVQ